MTHAFEVRVYYEDTDMAGIVYYANYLKFIERARSEWVRSIGIDQNQLRNSEGIVFAVRRVEADYFQPAKFDDVLVVRTGLKTVTGAKLVLHQHVMRGAQKIFSASVELVALKSNGRPTRLPEQIQALNTTIQEWGN